jgi:hypothetical protein
MGEPFFARSCGTRIREARGARRIGAAAVIVAALACAGGAAYAATGTTGDAQAIAFYSQSQSAMAGYEGIAFEGAGVSYKIIPAQGYDNFRFDFGTTLPGYRTAVDHVQVVQSGGRVIEEVDTLTAPGLPALRLWQHGPIGEVGEVMTATPCAETIAPNAASYVTVGGPYVVDSGFDFAPLKHGKHGHVLVRSTWSLSGSVVHETDTISASTHLWVRSHAVLSGGANNGDTLTEKDFHYSRSQAYEPPPQLGRC